MEYITKSASETMKLGEKLASKLKGGEIILLSGDLGAGKTTFTKGLARGLKIDAEVTSPTYAYMKEYDGKLYHFDAYRLKGGEAADGLGLTDYFYSGGVCVIEWYENIYDALPDKNLVKIKIEKTGKDKRKITIGD